MSLTPQEIQTREFREAFRGYNQDDVDEFLDAIAEEFGRVSAEGQRLRIQTAALQQEVARLRDSTQEEVGRARDAVKGEVKGEAKEEMKRALVAAQSAAESLLQEARGKADEILADAERKVKEKEQRALEAARSLDPVKATTIEDLQWKIDELKRQETEIRTRVREMLSEQLRLIDQSEAQSHHAATVDRMSAELGDTAAQEPNPQRFWTEPK
ncbi:MAG: DivIVA domain-containing protein [Actinomycetota bacterium]|nr:DivIVA domain-containing protein [Actinomycetota bacterium]